MTGNHKLKNQQISVIAGFLKEKLSFYTQYG